MEDRSHLFHRLEHWRLSCGHSGPRCHDAPKGIPSDWKCVQCAHDAFWHDVWVEEYADFYADLDELHC